jgi:hypothetical protein
VVTVLGLTEQVLPKRADLRAREGDGTPGGAVKCVEIRKNTEGEGSLLAGS